MIAQTESFQLKARFFIWTMNFVFICCFSDPTFLIYPWGLRVKNYNAYMAGKRKRHSKIKKHLRKLWTELVYAACALETIVFISMVSPVLSVVIFWLTSKKLQIFETCLVLYISRLLLLLKIIRYEFPQIASVIVQGDIFKVTKRYDKVSKLLFCVNLYDDNISSLV